MAGAYRLVDRGQRFLLPPDMSEWLPADHLVWWLLDVVEQLDTAALHERHPLAGPGRRAYDPEMLLALLLYAYMVGERSSRRIEAACADQVAFRLLCAQDPPDHTTIARFRAVHQDRVKGWFGEVLALCGRAGMGRVGSVAIDGTKIAANASMDANRTQAWLEAKVAEILAEAEATDAAEDELFGSARGDELPAEMADPSGRGGRIRRCLEQVRAERAEAEEAQRVSLVRAEEYMIKVEAGRPPPGRRPAGVDIDRWARVRLDQEQAKLATATEAGKRHQAQSAIRRIRLTLDREQARRALAEAERAAAAARGKQQPGTGEDTGHSDGNGGGCGDGDGAEADPDAAKQPRSNTTDPDSRLMRNRRGWLQGYNAQIAVSDDHLILAAEATQDPTDTLWFEPMIWFAEEGAATLAAAGRRPRRRPRRRVEDEDEEQTLIGTVLADAGYLSGDNIKIPGPDRLIALGTNHELHKQARANPASGPPPEDAGPLERMRHRLRTPEGASAYKRRAATVEPTIGQLKDRIGLRRFSRRGTPAVDSELKLAALALNLLRLYAHTTTTRA